MAKRNETKASKARAATKAGKAAPPVRVSRKPAPIVPAVPAAPDYTTLDGCIATIVRLRADMTETRAAIVAEIEALIRDANDKDAAANSVLNGHFGDAYIAAYMTRATGKEYSIAEAHAIRFDKGGATSQKPDRRTDLMERGMAAMRQEQVRIRNLGKWQASDARGGARNPAPAAKAAKAAKAPAAKAEPVIPAAESIGNSVALAQALMFHTKACMDLINSKPRLALNPWPGDVHALHNHLKAFLDQNKG